MVPGRRIDANELARIRMRAIGRRAARLRCAFRCAGIRRGARQYRHVHDGTGARLPFRTGARGRGKGRGRLRARAQGRAQCVGRRRAGLHAAPSHALYGRRRAGTHPAHLLARRQASRLCARRRSRRQLGGEAAARSDVLAATAQGHDLGRAALGRRASQSGRGRRPGDLCAWRARLPQGQSGLDGAARRQRQARSGCSSIAARTAR